MILSKKMNPNSHKSWLCKGRENKLPKTNTFKLNYLKAFKSVSSSKIMKKYTSKIWSELRALSLEMYTPLVTTNLAFYWLYKVRPRANGLYTSSFRKVLWRSKTQQSSPGLPWWLSGKESTCQCRRHGFNPWSGKIPHATEQLSPLVQLLSLCSRVRLAAAAAAAK